MLAVYSCRSDIYREGSGLARGCLFIDYCHVSV